MAAPIPAEPVLCTGLGVSRNRMLSQMSKALVSRRRPPGMNSPVRQLKAA